MRQFWDEKQRVPVGNTPLPQVAGSLTTAERVALTGPRKFCEQFDRSRAARGLLAKGLIDRPEGIYDPAPLTALGHAVLTTVLHGAST
jgi:hypothetical protein